MRLERRAPDPLTTVPSRRHVVPRGTQRSMQRGPFPTVSPDVEAILGEQEVRGACIYWGGLTGGEGSAELLAWSECGAGGTQEGLQPHALPREVGEGHPLPRVLPRNLGAARVKL